MIGGGQGSQIGYIHRGAALRDGMFQLSRAPSTSTPNAVAPSAQRWAWIPERCYPDYATLFAAGGGAPRRRAGGLDRDARTAPTTRSARRRWKAGMHVVCEKPLCFTDPEAEELRRSRTARARIVGVTYGYAGHQLIEQARRDDRQLAS